MNSLDLLESEWHFKLDVGSGIGIVCQLFMVVITIFLIAEAESLVPFKTGFFPLGKPFQFFAGTHKKLHLHLLEFPHTENELTGNDFIAECLAYLCNTEGNAHTTSFLHIEIVDKNTLRCLGTKIYFHRTVSRRPHLGREHEIELAYIGPVAGTAQRTGDFIIENNLAQLVQIVFIHGFRIAGMQLFPFGDMLLHTGIGLTEKRFIETFTESLGGFFHLFLYFFVHLGNQILDKHIGTITLLRVFIVDQRVIKRIDVPRRFPNRRVHKNGRIDTDNIFVQQHHTVPPIFFDIVFQLDPHLSVIIHGAQPIVYFTRRKYESIFFTMRNQFLKDIFLLCHNSFVFCIEWGFPPL